MTLKQTAGKEHVRQAKKGVLQEKWHTVKKRKPREVHHPAVTVMWRWWGKGNVYSSSQNLLQIKNLKTGTIRQKRCMKKWWKKNLSALLSKAFRYTSVQNVRTPVKAKGKLIPTWHNAMVCRTLNVLFAISWCQTRLLWETTGKMYCRELKNQPEKSSTDTSPRPKPVIKKVDGVTF